MVAHIHFGFDRHARRQHVPGLLIEDDFYGNALHDFDIITGGVFRREQTEDSASAILNAVDMPAKLVIGIRIDGDADRLPAPPCAATGFP